jgi:hypothetical protein
MRALPDLAKQWLLLATLTSCISGMKAVESPKLAESIKPTQTTQPTQVVVPADLAFSSPLVQLLNHSGLSVLSVQSSPFMSMFQSTDKAVWIKTDQGIVEAVFFADPVEAEKLSITQQPDTETERYIYTLQAPSATLLHDQIIDSAFPLYFTVARGIFMVTNSTKLDKILKHVFLER